MSCVLRVAGKSFDAAAFLRNSSIPGGIYRDSHRRLGRGGADSKHPSSVSKAGFNSTVSAAGLDDLAAQIRDAVSFLTEQKAELHRLMDFGGIETACLDFGVSKRDVWAQTDTFPAELLRLLGDLGIDLTVSHYAADDSPA